MSAVSDLVERAEALGARFTLTADSVKVTASGPLPPDLMGELREHKSEIIDHLRQRTEQATAAPQASPSTGTPTAAAPPPSGPGTGHVQPGPDVVARTGAFEQLRQQATGAPSAPQSGAPGPAPPVADGPGAADQAQQQPTEPGTPVISPSVVGDDTPSAPQASSAEEVHADGDDGPSKDGRFKSIFGSLDGLASRFGGLDGLASRLRRLQTGRGKEVVSITIEHGAVKLLVVRGLEVVDYKIVEANPRLFREGLVSDAARISALVREEIAGSINRYKRVVSAVPGYQTTTRRLDLPSAKGIDPKILIPQEAQRKLGISEEHSYLTWLRLPGGMGRAQWLVMSATNRSIASLGAIAESLGMKLVALELRSFALARAINEPDAVIAWTASDGCDAVVVRNWVPVTYQAAYWGTAASVEAADLVNRVSEVVESTVATHDTANPEMTVAEDIPIYVTGSPVATDGSIARRVASSVRHPLGEPQPPLQAPPDFPLHDLIVNVGLVLRSA